MHEHISQNANRKSLLQLLWLRLIAIVAQFFTIIFSSIFFGLDLPLNAMFTVLAVLSLASCFSFFRYQSHKKISDRNLFFELLLDVVALASQLYFSGGAMNPFVSLFLLQVTIAAILLRPIFAFSITMLTVVSYVFLIFNYHELKLLHCHEGVNSDENFFNLHLHGMLASYVIAALLLLVFITLIVKNLRQRDQKIEQMKQDARTGMLAIAAAHELGTPLSTISVIVGDWKSAEIDQKQLHHDVEIVEKQLTRCKKILSEILAMSGNERLEEATKK